MKEKDKNIKYPHILKMHKFMFLAGKDLDRLLDTSFNVGFSQCMILMFVEKNPRISQRHISHERDITPAAVSRHVEALVEKGFLRQVENKENKREHILEVSPRGERLISQMIDTMNGELEHIFRSVDDGEMDELDKLFNKLLNSFFR